jgi:hypothetical protein
MRKIDLPAEGAAPIETAAELVEKADLPKAKSELRNSLWCMNISTGRVGMINEINGSVITFHHHAVDEDGKPVLEAPIQAAHADLRICAATELPAHVAAMPKEQLEDIGYI